ncbi:hypothetical protein [uncultured Luteimonas sp.]|uniref:hypothetical protein n=1 Tax=uncultured Luteimonas sp. TaxID=453144 RepID=UPI00261EEAC3|nr:hypothetical protein [uncultured Luteimonas sp.]
MRMTSNTDPLLSILEEQSAARRAELAAEWPTAKQVGLAMGLDLEDASRTVTKYRREGRLLGVYMVDPEHHWRFPIWQFDDRHQPIVRFADVLQVLRGHGPYLDERGLTSGWGEVEWFLSGHVLLDGQAPFEVLHQDPDAVIEAARVEYIEEGNDVGF